VRDCNRFLKRLGSGVKIQEVLRLAAQDLCFFPSTPVVASWGFSNKTDTSMGLEFHVVTESLTSTVLGSSFLVVGFCRIKRGRIGGVAGGLRNHLGQNHFYGFTSALRLFVVAISAVYIAIIRRSVGFRSALGKTPFLGRGAFHALEGKSVSEIYLM